MAKLPNVAFKVVVFVVPSGAKKKVLLEEDLHQMGCHELMECPWCLKYETIMAELLKDQDN